MADNFRPCLLQWWYQDHAIYSVLDNKVCDLFIKKIITFSCQQLQGGNPLPHSVTDARWNTDFSNTHTDAPNVVCSFFLIFEMDLNEVIGDTIDNWHLWIQHSLTHICQEERQSITYSSCVCDRSAKSHVPWEISECC